MLRFIMRIPATFLTILAGISCLPALGQGTDPAVPAAASAASAAPPARESHWRLGAALGYGNRTNPLIQSEDIPVIVDLDIAWFGKRWFFDNGDVGFTMFDRPHSTTSAVARINDDRIFFGKTNTRYVNFAYSGNGMVEPLPPSTDAGPLPPIVEVTVPDRDYAVELGVESLIDGDWGAATLRAFHDVSGTHGGYELSADVSRRWTRGRLSFAPTIGVIYKSARMNDYYWGVKPEEANDALPAYSAGGGFSLEGGLLANYYISRSLRLGVSLNYESLADEVSASPLAKDDYVFAWFTGLAWTF